MLLQEEYLQEIERKQKLKQHEISLDQQRFKLQCEKYVQQEISALESR
jgi:hypothetical protein